MILPWSYYSGVARGFFTIASNTPGPEGSQIQTHRNYGTGGAASLERRSANRAHLEFWQLKVTATSRGQPTSSSLPVGEKCVDYAFTTVTHGS